MSTIPFISNENALTVAVDGKAHTVPRSAANYADLKKALIAGETDISVYKRLLNIRDYVAQLTEGRAELVDGKLYFDGKPVNGALAERVYTMFSEGFGVAPFLRFLNRLAANPRMIEGDPLYSPSFENELYLFLEGGDCPITEDGTFLAYKMIRDNYRDIYTNTMDNSPGSLVSLNKPTDVNPNRGETCARGLHFASLNYVQNGSYGHVSRGHRLVVVEVDPADVISIPYDYQNSKGRAWKYTILREIEWNDRIKANFLSDDDRNDWDEPEDEEYEDFDGDEDLDEDDEDLSPVELDENGEVVESTDQVTAKKATVGILDDDEVLGIRAALARGESLAAISRFFQVSARTVARIRDGETYTHVK